ncbi:MAG TPA: glycosyltransferase [Candidatus Polarisedimenticolia bacterium]|nr:glycosyltransferase [Candidatus Polarisedimenticolia bacterium]
MTDLPTVSVITPAYNHEKFIKPCIESLLAQTCVAWEQVIIDDGSTDRTAEIVQSYSDPRINYYHQENAGIEALAHTYNYALGLCRGELIAILEGDDLWPQDKMSKLVSAFKDDSVVLAYGEMQEIDVDGHLARRVSRTARIRMSLPLRVLFNDPPPAAAPYMLTYYGHSLIPASTVVIRRSALEAIGGFQYVPGQRYVDFPTFVRLSTQGKFYYTPEVVGYRRMHVSSATARFMPEMLEVAQKFRKELMADAGFGLTEADRKAIEKSWLPVERAKEFSLGRLRMLEGRWKVSRSHFLRALGLSDPRVTIGAAVGWLLSWLHRDLEGVFRLAGRVSLKTGS